MITHRVERLTVSQLDYYCYYALELLETSFLKLMKLIGVSIGVVMDCWKRFSWSCQSW